MPRNSPDPAVVTLALEQIRAGTPQREVARVLSVSASTIANWVRSYGEDGLAPRTCAPVVSPVDVPAIEPEGTTLDNVRAMQRTMRESARASTALGNTTAAQRYMRDAAQLVPVIARLERLAHDGADAVHITRAEIEKARSAWRVRVKALLERGPLLCAECSRRLSTAIAGALDPDAPAGNCESVVPDRSASKASK
jgi:transposase-like protein